MENYSVIKLSINEQYPDFKSFYSQNKDVIYKKILNVFEELVSSEYDRTRLIIVATVNNMDFDTNFFFEKSDPDILKEVINPYFEKKEDYEICSKVMETYTKLHTLRLN